MSLPSSVYISPSCEESVKGGKKTLEALSTSLTKRSSLFFAILCESLHVVLVKSKVNYCVSLFLKEKQKNIETNCIRIYVKNLKNLYSMIR